MAEKTYVVAITGASGVIYGVRFVEWMLQHGFEVHLIVSEPGRLVLEDEMGFDRSLPLEALFSAGRLVCYYNNDIASRVASGSFRHQGMIVIPCTMSTLAGINAGTSKSLIERAADVTLKEGRPLVLVPRETPLSTIHLRNMLEASQAGIRIIPAMPGFYHHPESIQQLVDFQVGKVLDNLGIENDLYARYLKNEE